MSSAILVANSIRHPEAAAILQRIISLGYRIVIRRDDRQIDVRAIDERTGELHQAVLTGDSTDIEYRGACALSDLVVAELDN
jgi:hypothetical protein